jgi:hypothetical protein
MKIVYRAGDEIKPVIKYKKPTLTERSIILSERLMANYAKRAKKQFKTK